jgi:hypothetical protein
MPRNPNIALFKLRVGIAPDILIFDIRTDNIFDLPDIRLDTRHLKVPDIRPDIWL